MIALLAAREIVDRMERMELDELTALFAYTGKTRGDAEFIASASEWFACKSNPPADQREQVSHVGKMESIPKKPENTAIKLAGRADQTAR